MESRLGDDSDIVSSVVTRLEDELVIIDQIPGARSEWEWSYDLLQEDKPGFESIRSLALESLSRNWPVHVLTIR